MADAKSKRWTRRFSTTLISTLAMQMLLPGIAGMVIFATIASRGDDHRTILTMITGMTLRAVIPIIGMLILMVLGLRRGSQVREGGLFKTLFAFACLASVPFYSILFISIPFAPPPSFLTRLTGAITGSSFSILIILCLSLRDDQPWMPRHPRTAIAISFLSISAMLGSIIAVLLPLLMPIGMMTGMKLSSAISAVGRPELKIIGQIAGIMLVMNMILTPALAWSVLFDRTSTYKSWYSHPRKSLPILAGLVIIGWQIMTPTSTFHRYATPERYAQAVAMQEMHNKLLELQQRLPQRQLPMR